MTAWDQRPNFMDVDETFYVFRMNVPWKLLQNSMQVGFTSTEVSSLPVEVNLLPIFTFTGSKITSDFCFHGSKISPMEEVHLLPNFHGKFPWNYVLLPWKFPWSLTQKPNNLGDLAFWTKTKEDQSRGNGSGVLSVPPRYAFVLITCRVHLTLLALLIDFHPIPYYCYVRTAAVLFCVLREKNTENTSLFGFLDPAYVRYSSYYPQWVMFCCCRFPSHL